MLVVQMVRACHAPQPGFRFSGRGSA